MAKGDMKIKSVAPPSALQKLKNEIMRRKAAEQSLKKSERHHRHLLAESIRMNEHLRDRKSVV